MSNEHQTLRIRYNNAECRTQAPLTTAQAVRNCSQERLHKARDTNPFFGSHKKVETTEKMSYATGYCLSRLPFGHQR